MKKQSNNTLDFDSIKIIEARHHDPFSVLGRHQKDTRKFIKVFLPYAETVQLGKGGPAFKRITGTDLFECNIDKIELPAHYQLSWVDKNGHPHLDYDPYDFTTQFPEFDQHLFGEGKHWHIYQKLGGHLHTVDGIDGVLFSVWAPNAGRVSVVGDFNRWDGRCNPMRSLGGSGIWEIFMPGLKAGCLYKFEILNRHEILLKTDPFGQQFEFRPKTSSIVVHKDNYKWMDSQWMSQRMQHDWLHEPMSIYEVHLGSWRRDNLGNFLNYRELAVQLVDYVKEMGFTHIELLPVTEHPLATKPSAILPRPAATERLMIFAILSTPAIKTVSVSFSTGYRHTSQKTVLPSPALTAARFMNTKTPAKANIGIGAR